MAIEFLLDKICLEHNTGYGHPEQPLRIAKIVNYFKVNKLENLIESTDKVSKISLNKTLEEIHDQQMINKVEKSKNKKETYFDQDTQGSNMTYEAALKAASLAMTAANSTDSKTSFFSIMRPPGHHATPQRIMGFCFFNNMALATKYVLERHKKIAIVDFDFHYGNGTADIFWNSPEVLYISMHADPSVNFPNQGFIDEIGSKDGKGYNVCIPLTYTSGTNEIIYSLQELVLPLLRSFKPSIIGMSAGFDGYYNDPVGGGYLQYDKACYNKIGNLFHNYSSETKTPIFHVLEGGYNVQMLPELLHSYVQPWLKDKKSDKDYILEVDSKNVKSREKKTIEYIKQIIKPYWNMT